MTVGRHELMENGWRHGVVEGRDGKGREIVTIKQGERLIKLFLVPGSRIISSRAKQESTLDYTVEGAD